MSFGNFEKHEDRVAVGNHKVLIAKMIDKENSKKTGRMLETHLSIVEGEFKGQVIRTWISYEHENPIAQNIGRKALDNIAKSVGYAGIEDLDNIDKLQGKVLTIELKKEESADFGTQSVVKNWNPKIVETKLDDKNPF